MKKIVVFLLVAILMLSCVSFAGCSTDNTDDPKNQTENLTDENTGDMVKEENTNPAENGTVDNTAVEDKTDVSGNDGNNALEEGVQDVKDAADKAADKLDGADETKK